MFCHTCGKKLTEEDIFCSSCGSKVVRPEPSASPASEEAANIEAPDIINEENPLTVEPPTTAENEPAPEYTEGSVPLVLADLQDEQEKPDTLAETNTSETDTSEPIVPVSEEEDYEEQPNLLFTAEQPVIMEADSFSGTGDIQFINTGNQKKQRKPRSGAVKAISIISSVLLAIIMGALLLALIMLIFLRTGFTEERIKNALDSIDYAEYKASSIFDIEKLSEKYEKEIPENATFTDIIYYSIDQDELVNPITKSEVDMLVKRLNFKGFISEKSAKAISILRSGSGEQLIYAQELIDFLRDNQTIIETTIGIPLLDIDFEYMQKHLEDKNDELLFFFSEVKMTDELGSGYKFLLFLFTDWFFAILCFLIIGIAAAIGFINRRVSSSLTYTGITFAIVALPLLIGTLIYGVVLRAAVDHSLANLIINISQPIVGALTVISALTVAVGVVALIIGIIIKVFSNKDRTKALYG